MHGKRWLLLVAACGRLDFQDRVASDATPTAPDGRSVDGAVDCTAFGTPVAMPAILQSSAQDWEPALRPDGVTLAFSSTRSDGGFQHLYMTTRQGASWTAPVAMGMNVLGNDDDGPAWNAAGDTLYFSSSRTGTDLLYSASFDGTSFGTAQLVPGLTLSAAVGPAVSHTELELFLTTPDPGGTGPVSQIFHASRTTTQDAWTVDGPVAELDDMTAETGWPSLSLDDLTIYFERGGDVFVAHRTQVGQPFDTPVKVTDVSFSGRENGDPEITVGGLMFASDEGHPGDSDLFEAPCD